MRRVRKDAMAMTWEQVTKFDARAAELADRHYSRQRPGSAQFMPPGRTLALLTHDGRALWCVALNLSPRGGYRWRCTLFRNEGAGLSSNLIREATALTLSLWPERYGHLPAVPLTTEVDPTKVRRKRDFGRCFLRAGWTAIGYRVRSKRKHGHYVFVAPGECDRLAVPFFGVTLSMGTRASNPRPGGVR